MPGQGELHLCQAIPNAFLSRFMLGTGWGTAVGDLSLGRSWPSAAPVFQGRVSCPPRVREPGTTWLSRDSHLVLTGKALACWEQIQWLVLVPSHCDHLARHTVKDAQRTEGQKETSHVYRCS